MLFGVAKPEKTSQDHRDIMTTLDALQEQMLRLGSIAQAAKDFVVITEQVKEGIYVKPTASVIEQKDDGTLVKYNAQISNELDLAYDNLRELVS